MLMLESLVGAEKGPGVCLSLPLSGRPQPPVRQLALKTGWPAVSLEIN